MAIAVLGGQSASNKGSAGSVTVTLPGPPTAGGLLFAIVAFSNTGITLSAASGWNKLGEVTSAASRAALFWKVAGSGESATQTVATQSSSAQWVVGICEAAGCEPGSGALESSTENVDTDATKTISAGPTPPEGVERLLVGAAVGASAAATWSAEKFAGSVVGVTELVDVAHGVNAICLCLFARVLTVGSGTYQAEALCSAAVTGSIHMAVFRPPERVASRVRVARQVIDARQYG